MGKANWLKRLDGELPPRDKKRPTKPKHRCCMCGAAVKTKRQGLTHCGERVQKIVGQKDCPEEPGPPVNAASSTLYRRHLMEAFHPRHHVAIPALSESDFVAAFGDDVPWKPIYTHLSNQDIACIRLLCEWGVPQREVAAGWGIHQSSVSHIVRHSNEELGRWDA